MSVPFWLKDPTPDKKKKYKWARFKFQGNYATVTKIYETNGEKTKSDFSKFKKQAQQMADDANAKCKKWGANSCIFELNTFDIKLQEYMIECCETLQLLSELDAKNAKVLFAIPKKFKFDMELTIMEIGHAMLYELVSVTRDGENVRMYFKKTQELPDATDVGVNAEEVKPKDENSEEVKKDN